MATKKITKLNALEMLIKLPVEVCNKLAEDSDFSGKELFDKIQLMYESEHKTISKHSARRNETLDREVELSWDTIQRKGVKVVNATWIGTHCPLSSHSYQKGGTIANKLIEQGKLKKRCNPDTGKAEYIVL